MRKITFAALVAFIIATGITFGLYQIMDQGFTHLTNYSKVPAYDLSGTKLYKNGTLFLQIARVAGPDTYGGFVVLVQVLSSNGSIIYQWNSKQLGHIPSTNIHNKFSMHPVRADGFALVVPLGQNATITLQIPHKLSPGVYYIRIYDVDGHYSAYGTKFEVKVKIS